MARPRYLPYVIAQRALLGVLLLLIVGVGWLYVYRSGKAGEGLRPPPPPTSPEGLEENVMASEGTAYRVSEDGLERFRVEADRLLSDRDDNAVLEGVRLTMIRDNDRVYTVEGERGLYQPASSDAQVEGDVVLRGPDDLELTANLLEVKRGGKILTNRRGPVRFALGTTYRGRADNLFYHLERDILRLSGDVRIDSVGHEPARGTLLCDRLLYEKNTGVIHIEGNVRLVSGESYVTAGRMGVQLDAESNEIRFIRGIWGVEGRSVRAGGLDMGSTTDFVGDTLSVAMQNGEPVSMELDGAGSDKAIVDTRDDAGLWRRMTAPSLRADYADGVLRVLRAYDGVEIVDRLDFGDRPVLRRICAEWALAGFDPAGDLEDLVLEQYADYQEPGLHALGDRIESAQGRMTLSGAPAHILTDRGQLLSDRIVYSPELGLLEAPTPVRAELPPDGRFSLMSSDAEEPVRLTANRARWSDELSTVEFSGAVRAWQGQNFLLADRLIGGMGGDELRAEGRVKTVMKPKPEPDPDPESEVDPASPPDPVEVTAQTLTYYRPDRLVKYSGSVRAHQVGRTLSCEELDIQLGERDRFDSLTCREDTMILDPAKGNTVLGREAYYRPDTGLVEVTGAPVTMRDLDGTSISGSILIYDFETGTAQVRSGPLEREAEEPENTS